MSWSREQVLAFLAEEVRLGRLATVSADGQPHVVPIWFEVAGDDLHVHTSAESRKARNIAATGRFAITVDTELMPYKGVSIQGAARVATNDEIDSLALARRLALAYAGPEVGPGFGEAIAGMPYEHVTLVLSPEGWEAWDFSQA